MASIFRSKTYWIIKITALVLVVWAALYNFNVTVIPESLSNSEYVRNQLEHTCNFPVKSWDSSWGDVTDAMHDSIFNHPPKDMPGFLQQVSCFTRLGLYEALFGTGAPDTVSYAQRDNVLKLLALYSKSKLKMAPSIPWTGHLSSVVGPGRLRTPLTDAEMDSVSVLMNQRCTCRAEMAFEGGRREARKHFLHLRHPMRWLGQIDDWYRFRLFWKKHTDHASPDLVLTLSGSSREMAEALKKVLMSIPFHELKPQAECLWYYTDFEIDLGDGKLMLHSDGLK